MDGWIDLVCLAGLVEKPLAIAASLGKREQKEKGITISRAHRPLDNELVSEESLNSQVSDNTHCVMMYTVHLHHIDLHQTNEASEVLDIKLPWVNVVWAHYFWSADMQDLIMLN